MEYTHEMKQFAYALDAEAWVSYSGKPKRFKQAMEIRRQAALSTAYIYITSRDRKAHAEQDCSNPDCPFRPVS